jgi:NADP-dependent 3-hydroxy acid dehydrogenase YdfG
VAIVAGVGPGLGAALVRKLAEEGCRVGMFARSPKFISNLVAELGSQAARSSNGYFGPETGRSRLSQSAR